MQNKLIDPSIPPDGDALYRRLATVLPAEISRIADQHGWELYAVGGCIRNLLLDRPLGDIDLAVVGDAPRLAREVARCLNAGKIAIYARFGTALVRLPDRQIELATSRRESYLPESRKPAAVAPAPIEEDLRRRDFTVNAMALGLSGRHQGRLLDLFHGWNDLKQGIIRTPLDPDVTFSDDPLRMMRAIRFAAELGFTIEPRTWEGIRRNLGRLRIVAPERLGDEFLKMLAGSAPARAMELLVDSGIMKTLIPEVAAMAGVEQINRHHHKDVLIHSLKVLQNVADQSPDPILRLAALLHDVGKPRTKRFDPADGWTFHGHEVVGARMAGKIGARLRLSNAQIQKVQRLVRLHMRPVNLTADGVTDSAIRRLMVEASEDLDDQLILCRADITTANPKLVKAYLANFEEMVNRMADVEAREKMRRFQSPVRGEEIMRLCNLEPGPLVGALKERVEDAILDGIIPYDYEAAKRYLLSIQDEVLNLDAQTLAAERKRRAQSRRRVTRDFRFPEDNGSEKPED